MPESDVVGAVVVLRVVCVYDAGPRLATRPRRTSARSRSRATAAMACRVDGAPTPSTRRAVIGRRFIRAPHRPPHQNTVVPSESSSATGVARRQRHQSAHLGIINMIPRAFGTSSEIVARFFARELVCSHKVDAALVPYFSRARGPGTRTVPPRFLREVSCRRGSAGGSKRGQSLFSLFWCLPSLVLCTRKSMGAHRGWARGTPRRCRHWAWRRRRARVRLYRSPRDRVSSGVTPPAFCTSSPLSKRPVFAPLRIMARLVWFEPFILYVSPPHKFEHCALSGLCGAAGA